MPDNAPTSLLHQTGQNPQNQNETSTPNTNIMHNRGRDSIPCQLAKVAMVAFFAASGVCHGKEQHAVAEGCGVMFLVSWAGLTWLGKKYMYER